MQLLIFASRVAPLSWLIAGIAGAATLDLPLPSAVDRALSANRALMSSRYARDAEEFSVLASLSEFDLKVVPTSVLGRVANNALVPDASGLNASIGAQLRKKLDWGTIVSVGPSYNRFGSASNTTLNVNVHQPLLSGFGREVVLDGVRRAEYGLASSERGYRHARVKLALETVGVYYTALREKYLADTNEALSERLRRHALVASRKEKAGLAGPSDTFRAQIRLKDAEDSAYQSRGAFELATGRLRHLLSLPADIDIQLYFTEPPAIRAQNTEQLAIDHSADFQQLRGDYVEAKRAARIAANTAMPDVSVNASYGRAALSDPLLQSFIPATQRQWSLFVQASGDLNRTAEKLNHRRTLLRVEALEVAMEDKTADIRREVRQQLRAIENARARIGLREEQIRQADGKLALAQVKFAHDMADNFELIEAESDLHRARNELSAAETEYAVGVYNLMAMTGQFP